MNTEQAFKDFRDNRSTEVTQDDRATDGYRAIELWGAVAVLAALSLAIAIVSSVSMAWDLKAAIAVQGFLPAITVCVVGLFKGLPGVYAALRFFGNLALYLVVLIVINIIIRVITERFLNA